MPKNRGTMIVYATQVSALNVLSNNKFVATRYGGSRAIVKSNGISSMLSNRWESISIGLVIPDYPQLRCNLPTMISVAFTKPTVTNFEVPKVGSLQSFCTSIQTGKQLMVVSYGYIYAIKPLISLHCMVAWLSFVLHYSTKFYPPWLNVSVFQGGWKNSLWLMCSSQSTKTQIIDRPLATVWNELAAEEIIPP